jgi:peptidoglycan/LPS O-acetylase OafA/YrhL
MPVRSSRDNNFDLLRLGAATVVLASHCWPLTGSGAEPLERLSGFTGGTLGVTVFFAISGYLVTLSWLSDPRIPAFLQRRGLRLLPGLAVVALLTAFVLGPLSTSLSPASYLSDPGPYLYAVKTSVLVTIGGTLPGVFAHNPFPDAVNGSLWTLPVEALAYVMVLGCGLLGLLRPSRTLLLAGLLLLLALLGSSATPLDFSGLVPSGAAGAGVPAAFRLAAVFVGGMLVALHRERIPFSWVGVVLGLLVWIGFRTTALEPLVAALAMPYAAITLAFGRRVRLPFYERGGDASYGIYVYAFPVQQVIADISPGIAPGVMFVPAFLVTFVLARLSWRLVESPALRRKPSRRLEPAQAP